MILPDPLSAVHHRSGIGMNERIPPIFSSRMSSRPTKGTRPVPDRIKKQDPG